MSEDDKKKLRLQDWIIDHYGEDIFGEIIHGNRKIKLDDKEVIIDEFFADMTIYPYTIVEIIPHPKFIKCINKAEAEEAFCGKVGDEIPIIDSRDLPNTWKNKNVSKCNIETMVVKTIIFNKNKEYYFIVEDSCPNCNWVSTRKYEEEPPYIPGIEIVFKYTKYNCEYYRIVKPFAYWNLNTDPDKDKEFVDNTHELVLDYVICGNWNHVGDDDPILK